MSPPSITVVVPCRNEARTLRACLDALALQDLPADRFEVLVVDGDSTDGSREAALEAGARVLRDPCRGAGAARNVGIAEARGGIVAFTDADCMPRSDWLTRVAECFAEDPDLAGVAGAIRMPRETLLGRLEDDDALAYYRGFITSNVAYRKDALLAVGGFDEALTCGEDHDLAWRLLDAGYRVEHDRRPVVVHAPPEVRGSVPAYLRKQFWYARHDVPTHARALARARRAPGPAGSARAAWDAMTAAREAALVATAAGALLSRRPLLAGIAAAGLLATTAHHVSRATHEGEHAALLALDAAKRAARGLGTLAGLADLARPSVRARLNSPSRVPLAPRPSRAPRGGAPWPRAPG